VREVTAALSTKARRFRLGVTGVMGFAVAAASHQRRPVIEQVDVVWHLLVVPHTYTCRP